MRYKYKAKNIQGEYVTGTIEAENEHDLVIYMRDLQLYPVKITKSHTTKTILDSYIDSPHFAKRKIKPKDRVLFYRELATMISAGVSLSKSFSILYEQFNDKAVKNMIVAILKNISTGRSLSDSMANHPEIFTKYDISLIASAEESGTLDETLGRIADFYDKQILLKKKISSALTYPCFVVIIAIIVLIIMVMYVIPQFQGAFRNLNVEMPPITKFVFETGDFLRYYWYTIPCAMLFFYLIFYFSRHNEKLRYMTDSIALYIPIVGKILEIAYTSRSCRTLCTLLNSGVSLVDSLEMTSSVISNRKIRHSFMKIKETVSLGQPLNVAMTESKIYALMVCQMVAVGEETGKTEEMLDRIAFWYESELEELTKKLTSILEPMMVVFVGIIVAFIVAAIFLPILSSIQAFL